MGEVIKIGKYEIISTLGQGAMGVVYQAFDPHIERTVALKTIRKDVLPPKDLAPLLTRFKQEAQAAGRLTHPGIVTVYEYGEDAGTVFIAMEFVPGRELKEILDRNERLQFSTAINLISQLLDALDYSHAQGVVHRDIKPSNIFIMKGGQIKVTDFGIAKIESSTLTQSGDILGTPSYMAPEQFTGQPVDRRSDLFSVGVVLYHLLTGEKPFPGNSMPAIMHRVLNTDPPNVSELNCQISARFDPVITKALAKRASERFQTAREFAAALQMADQDGTASAAGSGGDETILNYADHDEATIFQANASATAATAAKIPPDAPNAKLKEKTAPSVDLPQSGGQEPPQTDHLFPGNRRLLLSTLLLLVLSFCTYLVWTNYADTRNPSEQPAPRSERQAEHGSLGPTSPSQEKVTPGRAENLKKHPETEPRAAAVATAPNTLRMPAKVPDAASASKTGAAGPAPGKKAPKAAGPEPSELSWPPDRTWFSAK
ncbi:MAG: protein kinase [Desulfobulbaceae bacterium]|nr:protein kinase [Desulfobulbaceae bacterium]